MRACEAPGIIERGHERGGRDRSDARHALQSLDAGVHPRDGCDPRGRVRELLVDLAHDGKQGGELRQEPAGQRQGENPVNVEWGSVPSSDLDSRFGGLR